ncbi:hypothetical protein HYV58_00960, partial [Candidatus Peregrinibacteria bacterium]|nr:hypothetical protein [Candidatus Peregrinibacteria bacterium]
DPKNVTHVVETEKGKTGEAVDGKGMAELMNSLPENSHLRQLLKGYENDWSKIIRDPFGFVGKFFAACRADGTPVIVGEGMIVLAKADAALVFSTSALLYKTAKELIAAPFDGRWGEAISTYAEGAKSFVLIGAAAGAGFGWLTKSGALLGAVKGAGRGLIFPIEIPLMHIRAGQRIYRTARGAQFEIRKHLADEVGKIDILESEARYYAKISQNYADFLSSGKYPGLNKNWYAWLTQERAKKMEEEYMRRFQRPYNELRERRKALGLPSPSKLEESMLTEEGGAEIRAKFLEETEQPLQNGLRPLRVDSELFKNPDGKPKSHPELAEAAEKRRREIAALADDDPLKKMKRRELRALETFLDPEKNINDIAFDDGKFAVSDNADKALQLENAAAEIESVEKGTQARFHSEVENIAADAQRRNLPLSAPEITAKLEELDRKYTIPLASKKQQMMKKVLELYEKLPAGNRGYALRTQIRNALESAEGTPLIRFIKGAKGRVKMMVLMGSLIFATDQLVHRDETDREFNEIMAEMGPEMGQLFLDVLPIAGTFSNFYSAASGREIVSKRDVSNTWDRASNVLWGFAGLAADIVAGLAAVPTSGASIATVMFLRLTKEAKAGSKIASKLLTKWPRIEKIASRMGGWLEFAKKVKKGVGEKPWLEKGLRQVHKTAFGAGSIMMVSGLSYHLYYAFVDSSTELTLPQDIAAPQGQAAQKTASHNSPADLPQAQT